MKHPAMNAYESPYSLEEATQRRRADQIVLEAQVIALAR